MKIKVIPLVSFVGSCLITSGIWYFLWPQQAAETPEEAPRESSRPVPDAKSIAAILTEINTASSSQSRLLAAQQLADLPPEAFPAAFDSVRLAEGRELTRAGKMLLIQWASMDGEAAAQWSWMQLRGEGLWSHAFREIAAAWAWHDPAGLSAWALARIDDYKRSGNGLTLEEALRAESPVLESGDFEKAAKALIKEKPRLGYGLVVAKGGTWSHENLALSIETPEGIREALLAFDKVELKQWDPGDLMLQLLKRWQEIDPDGFTRSPHAELLEEKKTMPIHQVINTDGWKDLPPEQRASGAMAKIESYQGRGRQFAASAIASSWAKLDHAVCWTWVESLPEEYLPPAAAGYAQINAAHHLEETLDQVEQLPTGAQNRALVAAYRTWARKNSFPPENFDQWPAGRRQAWQDLTALRQIQDE